MPFVLLDGDTSSHGGTVAATVAKVYAEGKKIVRKNDILTCPTHGAQAITGAVSSKLKAENEWVALHGSTAACGATMISSATKTKDG